MDAANKILELVAKAKSNSTSKKKKWCALITLDVKNAFNTATWENIITCLKVKKFSKYLINFISSYLQNRSINAYHMTFKMSAGVPQGSVLGPHLWNIFYDDVLRIKIPGVTLIGFADDLSLVITADNLCELERLANRVLKEVDKWMGENKLELALQKTEAIILHGPRKREGIKIRIRDSIIKPAKELKYLFRHYF